MKRTDDVYIHLAADVSNFPFLDICWKNERLFVTGKYIFKGAYKGVFCSDNFNLKIEIPSDFPSTIPKVFEIDNKIPKDYHKNSSTELCLGTPVDLYVKWKERTFSFFIKEIVNPYLYRWIYFNKFGYEPWDDRSHGKNGIIEFYSEYLEIKADFNKVFKFLYILINGNVRSNTFCPCGSGRKIKSCHMHKLNKLLKKVPKETFQYEFRSLMNK